MNQVALDLGHELVVDLFAGGGGASCGIEQGIGRPVDIAVNHDPMAVAMHEANHARTTHFCESVFKVNPVAVTGNQPVGLLWASPDCTHHSKAKGGKPVSAKRRGLAWVVIKWARRTRPRVIMLENVEEFEDWGPLTPKRTECGKVLRFPDGKPMLVPCPDRKGQEFQKFKDQLKRLGYQVEHRQLRACDYGAPTIRKRFFLIARRDGRPIVWPKPTHGAPDSLPVRRGKQQPYRTAAECIDWSIPCPSIFTRKKPLAENTMRRIAHGMKRFVIDAKEPFIVKTNHTAPWYSQFRGQGLREPLQTVTASHGFALVTPSVIAIDHGSARSGCNWSVKEPLTTVTTENRHALVTAFLAKHYTGVIGTDVRKPLSTVTTIDHHSLVAAFMAPYYSSGSGETGRDLRQPAPTATTKDRLQLITVQIDGTTYVITDIGMRMLKPHELFKAQGFPDDYVIAPEFNGKPIPGYAQVRMCGNSVPPVWPQALVEANFVHEKKLEATA
ncbi:MAG: DNA (cytosine-5-)-methyltransferase [Rhodopirellula sp.]|nr:DNA (cytosine-5-)-methyltransferase [Rhodopirellula sp.]HCA35402.1 DNA (cytosine-5-)-methyltransferase [Gammaproteobacteria bacterium]